MTGFKVGEPVTIMPPWDDDEYIVSFQHYGRIASGNGESGYLVELDYAAQVRNQVPQAARRQVGPFPAHRLAHGWRDSNGRWLAE